MTLLERVSGDLAARQVPHALIGAAAMAVHGVSRSTVDEDLLVTDRRVLEPAFWSFLLEGTSADVRPGSADDPLAGVVRVTAGTERHVDLVVGRAAWQTAIIERAAARTRGGQLPVAEAADLVLLKLYAGGSQDRWDIEQLIGVNAAAARVVDARATELPRECQRLWAELQSPS